MKNLKATLIALTGSLFLTACGDDRFPDYNYKMTIHVGDKAFSSVRAIKQEESASIIDSSGRSVKTKLQGEAVIINLSNGRTVYALLSKPDNADYGKYIPGAALGPYINRPKSDKPLAEQPVDPFKYLDNAAGASQQMVKVEGAKELPRTLPARQGRPPFQAWPMFVTFDNPANPRTVREVSPGSIGVKRITIEITNEDVTTGVETRLAWLPQYYEKQFSGARFQKLGDYEANGLSAVMSSGAFSAGSGLSPFERDD